MKQGSLPTLFKIRKQNLDEEDPLGRIQNSSKFFRVEVVLFSIQFLS